MTRGTQIRLWLARVLLVGSLIGWPVSLVTFARHEPPTVLSLSWIALIYAALTALFTAEIKRDNENGS